MKQAKQKPFNLFRLNGYLLSVCLSMLLFTAWHLQWPIGLPSFGEITCPSFELRYKRLVRSHPIDSSLLNVFMTFFLLLDYIVAKVCNKVKHFLSLFLDFCNGMYYFIDLSGRFLSF